MFSTGIPSILIYCFCSPGPPVCCYAVVIVLGYSRWWTPTLLSLVLLTWTPGVAVGSRCSHSGSVHLLSSRSRFLILASFSLPSSPINFLAVSGFLWCCAFVGLLGIAARRLLDSPGVVSSLTLVAFRTLRIPSGSPCFCWLLFRYASL